MAVGLSGGIDSVALLHAVKPLARLVIAVHVHHGLSHQADHWADFCVGLCDRWRMPIMVHRVQVERGSPDGLEAAARRARHAVFASVEADRILLAHHRGDQAETLLFNLLRGCGMRGAGAMREASGRLLRPLLAVSRADIVEYARAHELDWVEDESNQDSRYSRNFLRHGILPALRQRFPATEERLSAAAARFAEAADLLDELALQDLDKLPPRFPVPLGLLTALSEPRARNVLRLLLGCHGVAIPSEERLVEALRQLRTAGPDRHPAIRFGPARLRREHGRVVLDID
jgi:tRNA(Ile)-lysidine synthase